MPTNTNAYNSRVTDEALEKRFRDTFRSQGGAELVDDLYAQGVIVPIVDFTAAATGQQLAENLQTAWDFSTGFHNSSSGSTDIITTAGFWQINLVVTGASVVNAAAGNLKLRIDDGVSTKTVWGRRSLNVSTSAHYDTVYAGPFVVFLRAGDSLNVYHSISNYFEANVWYRQIATVSGDLIDPSGFTSS